MLHAGIGCTYPTKGIVQCAPDAHGRELGIYLSPSILIVDDSPDIRRALRRLFETRAGWTVCGEAIDGKDGIEKAQQLKPNAIVLDMAMPGMDGLQTAKVLTRIMPEIPLVMFTNFAHDQFVMREVLAAGIKEVVSKPDSQGLIKALEAALV